MGLISTTIPTLIGGVSQQPSTIRMASQCEVMENCFPSVVEFLRGRPATRHIARLLDRRVTNAATHVINRDASEQYVVILADNQLLVFDLQGNKKIVNLEGASAAYLATGNPESDVGFLTVNDYTFILNRLVTVHGDAALSAKRPPEALVFIKQASYATSYTVTLDGTAFTHNTFKDDNRNTAGLEYNIENFSESDMKNSTWKDANRYRLSSSTIASDLASKINAQGMYTCTMRKSALWIRRNDAAAFTASVVDSRSNTHISVATQRIQQFSDLPTVAPNGYTVEITGDQSSSFDNYYVRFKTSEGTSFDDGVWEETIQPGIPYKLDASTMPHALVREADGTFTFKALTWDDRTCGDLDSAPDPSFIGREISSIFFYLNRLGVLSGENCILSETGELFNFFPTTVTTLVDSDPIDTAAGHTKATTLYHATNFSEGLLLFSDQTQFILEHDSVFSGETTAVKPLTEFECSIKAAPVGAGRNIFFATSRGQWAGVREYFVEEGVALTDAADITSHVPHYIEGDITKLVVSSGEDCLLALSSQNRKSVALYKYFWNGREKLQSSWSKWTFTGEVLAAAFLKSALLLVIQYSDGVYLETMRLEPGYVDENMDYEYQLDRKLSEKEVVSVVYDDSTGLSTITLPYILPAAPAVVSRRDTTKDHPWGVNYNLVDWAENSLTVRGDLQDIAFFVGLPYTRFYEFSPQVLREDTSSGKLAVVEGRLQLRSFSLTYAATGYFEVRVTPDHRDTNSYIFAGRILGRGDNILGLPAVTSGTFRFPVLSQADAVKIQIISDSVLPFQITSAGWEGYFHMRSRRV